MSISCSCYDENTGITAVGEPKYMTCRTGRKCNECGAEIHPGDGMYRYSCYDWDECQTVAPHWMCEACGDLMVSVMELGFCFQLGDIKGQWQDFLDERAS